MTASGGCQLIADIRRAADRWLTGGRLRSVSFRQKKNCRCADCERATWLARRMHYALCLQLSGPVDRQVLREWMTAGRRSIGALRGNCKPSVVAECPWRPRTRLQSPASMITAAASRWRLTLWQCERSSIGQSSQPLIQVAQSTRFGSHPRLQCGGHACRHA